ncbi:hypothetical protein C7I36_00655 [Zobellella taiwanensis]|uniref:Uncharacterized protein n=2 Tax=Zobellella taiwanensis TaxID=347535 RepID=A0A2P7RDR3_9GAMM|nr:hypothetical protein C7I36_00655 [Zobellella taiwanensis]
MNLTLAIAALCNWRLAETALVHISSALPATATPLETELHHQQLAGILAKDHTGAVVLYAPLELALEHAMAQGMEPSQAIALWQHNATLLVRFCKQHRGKAALFNLADVTASPELFKALCAQLWPQVTPNSALIPAGHHQPALLYRLLAGYWLSATPSLLSLSQQLAALAQPLQPALAPQPAAEELNRLAADYQAGQKARQQLAEVEEKLESVTKERDQALASISAITKERDAALQSVAETAALRQENSLLLEQLFTVQEELEKHLLAQQPVAITTAVKPEPTHAEQPEHAVHHTGRHTSSLRRHFKKRAEKKRLQQKAAELAASSLFNGDWYLAQYPDVAADKQFATNPALHYLKCGGFEGRNPSPQFNSRDYLDANPDVAAAGFNPLYHYLRFGQAENRPLY